MNNPTVHWREPGDVTAVLDVPAAGVFLGVDSDRSPVLLPAVGPRVTRIGVVGDWRIAALLAYRLLGAGCLLTMATAEPGRWRHLLDAAGSRGSVARSGAGWPPPAGGAAHLLVTDLATPPNPASDTRTPCWSPDAATARRWPGCWAATTPAHWTRSAPPSSGCSTGTGPSP